MGLYLLNPKAMLIRPLLIGMERKVMVEKSRFNLLLNLSLFLRNLQSHLALNLLRLCLVLKVEVKVKRKNHKRRESLESQRRYCLALCELVDHDLFCFLVYIV
jgi:hypothetical protein